jgi:FixJ family two-component response regulator
MLPGTDHVDSGPPVTRHQPRVLLVDDDPAVLELLGRLLVDLNCRVTVAKDLASAKRSLSRGARFQLMLADVQLPDGDGLSLLAALRRRQPTAAALILTGGPSVERCVTALRGGAADFLLKPFDNLHLQERVRMALARQSAAARQEMRLQRLRDAVKRLGIARRMVSKKVDLLCNDLVAAYGELSTQVDTIRTEENFRKHLAGCSDLEQMLCQTMDWVMRSLGYANVALWLAGDDGAFQMGAYMKYTVAGEEPVVKAMQHGMLPRVMHDGSMHMPASELIAQHQGSPETRELCAPLAGQDLLGVNCTYLGDPLAAMLFFRDIASPFTEMDAATLKAIAPVFASTLATLVRDPGEDPRDLDEPTEADDSTAPPQQQRRRSDDWWKNGEPPPF